MAVSASLIGRLGGGSGAAYGEVTSTVSMPREWAPIQWDEHQGLPGGVFTAPASGQYRFSATIQKESFQASRAVALRITVNSTVEHTTSPEVPGHLLHTITLDGGDEVVVEAYTDTAAASAREIHPGSFIAIIPLEV